MRSLRTIAHAACKGHAPENTLAGLDAAIAFGVEAIEIDVRCCAGEVPVLMHDATVDRTTDGCGPLAALPLAAVRSLDAGDGEPVPSLEEALEQVAGRALCILEIKEDGIESAVIDVVRRTGRLRDCEIHSFRPNVVAEMRQLEPTLPAALLSTGEGIVDWQELIDAALTLNAQALSVAGDVVDADRTRQAQRRGLDVHVWTVNERIEMDRLVAAGVDGICTDYPDRLALCLSER